MECFTVYAEQIEGRIDPFYYKPEFVKFHEKISSSKFKFKEISQIAKVICGPFGSAITTKDYKTEGVPLIRISNIEEDHLSKEDIKFISKEQSLKLKPYIVKNGDLIISQRGTLGLAVKIDESFEGAVISANFIAIKDLQEISPDLLQILLSAQIGQIQLLRKTSGQVQTKITTEDIKTIRIPVLPKKIQIEIMDKIKRAYLQKARKEFEAQQQLNSINDYILNELKIKLPDLKEKLIYTVYSDATKKGRLDPRYYKPYFLEFEEELIKRKDIKRIGEIAEYLGSGSTPRAGGEDYTSKEEGVPFIRIVNLKNNTVVLDDVLYIKKSIHESMLKRTQLKPNDVLLSIAGTIGLSVVVPKYIGEANINQAIARIVLNKAVNPLYLSIILNSQIGKIQTERLSRPSVQSNINLEEISILKIPLPPLAIQNEITEEIKKRIQKAEQLQKEAKEELEKAKQEVEKMVLG